MGGVPGQVPPWAGTPPRAGTPPMVDEQAVRILLECILVIDAFVACLISLSTCIL